MLELVVKLLTAWVIVGCIVVLGYVVLNPTFQFVGVDQVLVCILAWPWFLYQVGYVGPVPLTHY